MLTSNTKPKGVYTTVTMEMCLSTCCYVIRFKIHLFEDERATCSFSPLETETVLTGVHLWPSEGFRIITRGFNLLYCVGGLC